MRFDPRIKPTYAQIFGNQQWRTHPLMNGCRHFWIMAEPTGLVIPDICRGADMTITGPTATEAWAGRDKWGNIAFQMDGANDYAVSGVTGNVMGDVGSHLMQIEVFDTAAKQRCGGLANAWEMDTNGSNMQAEYHLSGAGIAATGFLSTNIDYTVACRYKLGATNAVGEMYIDSNLEDTDDRAFSRETATTWYIGWRAGASTSERLHGAVSRMMVWDRELRLGEIQELYYEPYIMFRPREKYWIFSAPVVLALKTGSESIPIGLTDESDPVLSTVTDPDTIPIGLTDLGTTAALIAGADSMSIQIVDGSALLVLVTEADIIPIGLTELGTLIAGTTYEQEGYRWRNDDGTEVTATWQAAQDDSTGLTVAVGDNVRIRWVLDTTGLASTVGAKIQFRIQAGPEAWRDVEPG